MAVEKFDENLTARPPAPDELSAVVLNSTTEVVNDRGCIETNFKLSTINAPTVLLSKETVWLAL